MKFLLLIFFAFHFSLTCLAQVDSFTSIPSTGKQVSDFIPNGYKELFKTKGDLNNDGKQDIALAIFSEKTQIDTVINKEDNLKEVIAIHPAILIILLNQGNYYKVLAKTLKAVHYDLITDMLHSGNQKYFPAARINPIIIHKNELIIYTYSKDNGWEAVFEAKFKYINDNFFLVHTTNKYYKQIDYCRKIRNYTFSDRIDVDYVTGKQIYTSIDNCKRTIEKTDIEKHSLVNLNSFNIFNYLKDPDSY